MTTLDLNILPIRRMNSQESAEIPGLVALTPPRKTARGREHTALVAYLSLSGNAPLTGAELRQLVTETSSLFYQTTGSLTFAMRAVANELNARLLGRNLSAAGQGQQMLGWLVLAAIRESQCTLLLSGPTHVVWVTDGGSRHVHDPALSGKGLGAGQNAPAYLSQLELRAQDLLVFCSIFPRDWEADLLNERPPASLDASYRKLTFTRGDLNAVLLQAQNGHGAITLLKPQIKASPVSAEPAVVLAPSASSEPAAASAMMETEPQPDGEEQLSEPGEPPITEEELDALADFGAHMVQPSAYAIPLQPERPLPGPQDEPNSNGSRSFPSSIPRAQPLEPVPVPDTAQVAPGPATPPIEEPAEPASPPRTRRRRRRLTFRAPAAATKQVAKTMVGGIRTGRRVNERFRSGMHQFLPRLLPSGEPNKPFVIPTLIMVLIAIVIPVIVVTMSSVVYLRLGQSIQYDDLYGQASNARAQAVSETDPIRQRDAWQRVLSFLNKADEYRAPEESRALRAEAQANLDQLLGVIRLEFVPAFPNGLGGSGTQISRMAASESDLYMLDSDTGRILHAAFTGRGLELDRGFTCEPGSYGGYQVTALVDIIALPKVNTLNATVMGIDANGNLLYCAPDQVAQAIPLPALPNTNWGRISAVALDSGSLYVLDAQNRSVWVFPGKDSTFVDSPFFYFGNEIPASIDSAIDLAVSGDDLYMLRADGQLATCKFSRLSEVPTRCQDPAPRLDKNPARLDTNVFQLAHFTQMAITNPPNSVILLLDADSQSVYRFSPRSFELQNQITGYAGKASPFPSRSVSAMAVSPNYVLYFAIGDQVYFATNLP